MRKYLIILFLIPISTFSQSTIFNFHSLENIKKFADYLFCQGDYLRAVEEYGHIPSNLRNDTINFKVMLCYSQLNLYHKAEESFLNNDFYEMKSDAEKLYIKNEFLTYPMVFHSSVSGNKFPFENNVENRSYFLKLRSIYYIQTRFNGITKEDLFNPFDAVQKKKLEPFYEMSLNPNYKSPALAGILSAAIPGSGKMYVGEWGDGITALLTTGLLAFLAYDNFRANHDTRAWIFTGLGVFFYAGNIYGSIASAQIFNAKINFDFEEGLQLFLEKENYFLPQYDFCK